MILGGFQKSSLIDYPGKVSSIVFTKGCNFRCFYCYNKELWENNGHSEVDEQDVLDYLDKRRGMIDALVITGGEPTLQPDLLDFMAQVKAKGYLVKLDSNGAKPEIIREALKKNLVDYLAMDIKASLEKYEDVTKVNINQDHIKESIEILKSSGKPYEFRTTFCTPILGEEDIARIGQLLGKCKQYILQPCHYDGIDQGDLGKDLKLYRQSFPQISKCFVR
ncbi:anaerobic ribonucleoside-triphosphate reductase activating protein [Patescibacteria group bacterium]|nr:anaerobic ribonucleoside-triphosphate reductase activating protein [Patescibacteria group bacterium]